MEQQLNLNEPVSIDLDWRCGDIHLTAADGPNFVRIDGPEDLAECTVELREGGRLIITMKSGARHGNSLWGVVSRVLSQQDALTLTVAVPTGSTLRGKSGAGDLDLRGTWDSVELRAGAGDISIDQCHELDLTTGGGDIKVQKVTSQLALVSAGGDARLESIPGSSKVKTAGGDVAAGISGPGATAITTMGGDLDIRVVPDLKVWADVATMGGNVQRDLTPRGEPGDGEPHLSLKLRTLGGDIRLQDA